VSDRLRRKAAEAWEEERQMNELNESAARWEQRNRIAAQIAIERFEGDDDLDIPIDEDSVMLGDMSVVESVDGGYWVTARVWVYADDVEERMGGEDVPGGRREA
jgi:hypothetical protein